MDGWWCVSKCTYTHGQPTSLVVVRTQFAQAHRSSHPSRKGESEERFPWRLWRQTIDWLRWWFSLVSLLFHHRLFRFLVSFEPNKTKNGDPNTPSPRASPGETFLLIEYTEKNLPLDRILVTRKNAVLFIALFWAVFSGKFSVLLGSVFGEKIDSVPAMFGSAWGVSLARCLFVCEHHSKLVRIQRKCQSIESSKCDQKKPKPNQWERNSMLQIALLVDFRFPLLLTDKPNYIPSCPLWTLATIIMWLLRTGRKKMRIFVCFPSKILLGKKRRSCVSCVFWAKIERSFLHFFLLWPCPCPTIANQSGCRRSGIHALAHIITDDNNKWWYGLVAVVEWNGDKIYWLCTLGPREEYHFFPPFRPITYGNRSQKQFKCFVLKEIIHERKMSQN